MKFLCKILKSFTLFGTLYKKGETQIFDKEDLDYIAKDKYSIIKTIKNKVYYK